MPTFTHSAYTDPLLITIKSVTKISRRGIVPPICRHGGGIVPLLEEKVNGTW